ncbi:MAG: aldehyde dehydrogenase family protein [SAR202 cluster bacterium]|nr:aldehyde dehydrogenase family protein [SAR202 cluster bacterium]
MKMYIGGKWVDASEQIEVINPFDNSIIDTVPKATPGNISEAISSAVHGKSDMAKLSGYDRYTILSKAAQLLLDRKEDIGKTISLEEGKILAEGLMEVDRAIQTMINSAEEAKRLNGETIPLDAAPTWTGQIGFTLRVPCGVVAAITPFNFPLNLVCHKVGPAIAGGNSVIIKPATDTPLSALKLTEIMLDAGLPPEGIQCITGSGKTIGDHLTQDSRIRKITFTGSKEVGEHICRTAGLKRVTMELGSNAPLIIMPDADIDKVVKATVSSGFSNAGQVCISAQRILTNKDIYSDFVDALTENVENISTGNQLDPEIKMGPMVRSQDATRVNSWIKEATSNGARTTTGGEYQGALHQPTVVVDVSPDMTISCEELFGPAVAVTPFTNIEQAIELANDSNYGLSAGIFTQNIDWAMKFIQEVDSGNLMINSGPQWRADLMPYGGLKDSGMGKEGPKYAIQEMTELKMVVYHP